MISFPDEVRPEDVRIERRRLGEVVVTHVPTGLTKRCRKHPVSTMNEDSALAELILDLQTFPGV